MAKRLYQESDGHECHQQEKLTKIEVSMAKVEVGQDNIAKDVNTLFKELRDVKNALQKLTIEVTTIKTKASVWGALIGSIVVFVGQFIMKKFGG